MTNVRIIEKDNGIVQFVLDEAKASVEDKQFVETMSQYESKILNSSLVIRNAKTQQVATHIHITDNTQMVNDLKLANLFGAKRFLVGKLASTLQTEDEKAIKEKTQAIKFSRDISFPLIVNDHPWQSEPLRLDAFSRRCHSHNVHSILAEVFHRCADFTPGKQEEYRSGGKLEDKYCRFNPANQKDDNVIMDHVFICNADKTFGATISYTIVINNTDPNNIEADIYFYDEVTDYFKLLSTSENNILQEKIKTLQSLIELEEKKTATKAQLEQINPLKDEINEITNKARTYYFKPLFAWAALFVRDTLVNKFNWSEDELDQAINKNMIRGFIRAAAGREALYQKLGCGNGTFKHCVIHGPRTPYGVLLDQFFKERASQELQATTSAQYSPASLMSQQRGYGQSNNDALIEKTPVNDFNNTFNRI